MKCVLITGLSGTGKSSLLRELSERGFRVVDTDFDGWRVPPDGSAPDSTVARPDWIWDGDRMRELLTEEVDGVLFVSGCVDNQGEFRDLFDEVILLSVPEQTVRERLSSRAADVYGGSPADLERELKLREEVEPLLRESATLELDTSGSLEVLADEVVGYISTSR
ncbi:AAA family ATPase [Salininema proteolyticum]|uniref:AAA family ATPase n=1 Tax=Salininema proteolyticum TaxID=1607685 RepID=A0ABV8U4G0_9ACTN